MCEAQLDSHSNSTADSNQKLLPWCYNMVVYGDGAFSSYTCSCTVVLCPNNHETKYQKQGTGNGDKSRSLAVIPDNIDKLEGVKYFILTYVAVESIPSSLWQMKGVRLFMMNGIEHSKKFHLPRRLGFDEISLLYLTYSNITGSIPSQWGEDLKDTEIQSLALSGNNITGTLPPVWSKLKYIKDISFNSNPSLSGTIPSEWKSMEDLVLIFLGGTNITTKGSPFPESKMHGGVN